MGGRPNILIVMTDEERYPPPYEAEALHTFRGDAPTGPRRLREGGLELHRHYVASTACLPSRASLFTGQYPSLHGVTQTDGTAKRHTDPAMQWLDPSSVPTMGDWFRAGGYRTHYRGKWHISYADLVVPGTHDGLMASDSDGRLIPEAVDAYRRADRLDPFGFSGWIGREPHGAAKADTGVVRDGVFAEQVIDLFGALADARDEGPWLAVASFVNPHDIAFSGWVGQLLAFAPPDASVPDVPEAPSQSDSLADRPACQGQFRGTLARRCCGTRPSTSPTAGCTTTSTSWWTGRSGASSTRSTPPAWRDDTIVVFTSDHGDMLGAHGGLVQKWYNAYDETIRVPLIVHGPGVAASTAGIDRPTSHVDLLPTLLGLAGIDLEQATRGCRGAPRRGAPASRSRPERPADRPAAATADDVAAPVYFMTEDDITNGLSQTEPDHGEAVGAGRPARSHVESVISTLPTGGGGAAELWKLNRYYDRLDEWDEAHGLRTNPFAAPAAEPDFELHNLSADPEERANRAGRPARCPCAACRRCWTRSARPSGCSPASATPSADPAPRRAPRREPRIGSAARRTSMLRVGLERSGLLDDHAQPERHGARTVDGRP